MNASIELLRPVLAFLQRLHFGMQVLYDTDTTSKVSSAILWGKLHESTAYEHYIKSFAPNEHLRHCGIYILKHDGFLSASLMELWHLTVANQLEQ